VSCVEICAEFESKWSNRIVFFIECIMRGAGRKRSTRKNKKVVKRGRKTVRSKTARKQRLRRSRRRIGGVRMSSCSVQPRGMPMC